MHRMGGDLRGSNVSRKIRKRWLLREFGNGETTQCFWQCGKELDFNALTVDRFPICGHEGGRYVRGNIVPACFQCNRYRCDATWAGGMCMPHKLFDIEETIDFLKKWRNGNISYLRAKEIIKRKAENPSRSFNEIRLEVNRESRRKAS